MGRNRDSGGDVFMGMSSLGRREQHEPSGDQKAFLLLLYSCTQSICARFDMFVRTQSRPPSYMDRKSSINLSNILPWDPYSDQVDRLHNLIDEVSDTNSFSLSFLGDSSESSLGVGTMFQRLGPQLSKLAKLYQ